MAAVAHAIRRSTALYLAVITSTEGTSDGDLFARADTYAAWLRGRAGTPPEGGEQFLGLNPWSESAP